MLLTPAFLQDFVIQRMSIIIIPRKVQKNQSKSRGKHHLKTKQRHQRSARLWWRRKKRIIIIKRRTRKIRSLLESLHDTRVKTLDQSDQQHGISLMMVVSGFSWWGTSLFKEEKTSLRDHLHYSRNSDKICGLHDKRRILFSWLRLFRVSSIIHTPTDILFPFSLLFKITASPVNLFIDKNVGKNKDSSRSSFEKVDGPVL